MSQKLVSICCFADTSWDGHAHRCNLCMRRCEIKRKAVTVRQPARPLSTDNLFEKVGDCILFKSPKNNRWDLGFKECWIAAKNDDKDYLCCSENFIDTHFEVSAKGRTPREALLNLLLLLK